MTIRIDETSERGEEKEKKGGKGRVNSREDPKNEWSEREEDKTTSCIRWFVARDFTSALQFRPRWPELAASPYGAWLPSHLKGFSDDICRTRRSHTSSCNYSSFVERINSIFKSPSQLWAGNHPCVSSQTNPQWWIIRDTAYFLPDYQVRTYMRYHTDPHYISGTILIVIPKMVHSSPD